MLVAASMHMPVGLLVQNRLWILESRQVYQTVFTHEVQEASHVALHKLLSNHIQHVLHSQNLRAAAKRSQQVVHGLSLKK